MSFTNFTGDDEVTETATEAKAVTEPDNWVCDIDWTQTYTISKIGIWRNFDFDLNDIWGPSGPGTGQDKGACYKESKCRRSNDANGQYIANICQKTYGWYKAFSG